MRLHFIPWNRPARTDLAGPMPPRQGGQALVEFSLILAPFLLIIFGIIQMGLLFSTQLGLSTAARDSARYASTLMTTTSSQAATNGTNALADLRNVRLPQYVIAYTDSNLVTAGGASTVRYCDYQNQGTPTTWSIRVIAAGRVSPGPPTPVGLDPYRRARWHQRQQVPTRLQRRDADRGPGLEGRPGRDRSMRLRRFHRSHMRDAETGQGLVEFAFVVPILLVIMLGIVQLGWILTSQIGLTNSIREAARFAATQRTVSAVQAGTNGSATVGQLNLIMPRNVNFFGSGNVSTASASYCQYTDPKGDPTVRVRVTVQYRHPLFIPLISGILDGVDGVSDNALLASAVEEMRVENSPPLTSSTGITSC